jgi:transposase-like protein
LRLPHPFTVRKRSNEFHVNPSNEASGHVEIDVPRDRAGTFDPQIVKKRQRRLNGVDEIVLSLYAKGLTTGEISAHFAEIYGASVSKEMISRITDRVIEEMNEWSVRPLDELYAAIFIDAIVVKVRDGQVANRPIYATIGVSLDGERDILGLGAGTGGEGAGTVSERGRPPGDV